MRARPGDAGGRRTPSPDAWLIYGAAFVRAMLVGFAGVSLAVFLADLGLPAAAAGALLGLGLAGAAIMTGLVTARGDRFGRRRTLILLSTLTAVGYAALALASRTAVLLPLALVGMFNGMGRDRGAAAVLEQAMLPETTAAGGRTWVLAGYHLVLDVAHAVGALAAFVPSTLTAWSTLDTTAAHRLAFGGCAIGVLLSGGLYAFLSPRVEVEPDAPSGSGVVPADDPSRHAVRRLAWLFGVDSLGGGFLGSTLIAYWFVRRFGLSELELALVFFAARVLNAASHAGAAWLARRIGLVNTMVWTHLPSSLLLMAAPTTGSAALAVALFLAREACVEMDVPTRQSYIMAIVPPTSRTFASGVTNLTRIAGWAAGSAMAGVAMQHLALAAPLFIGATLKIGYDVSLYRGFRHLRPPEERVDSPAPRDERAPGPATARR